MVAIIVIAEIAFWVLIALGLSTRYLLRRPRTGLALLAATPAVDALLLVAVAIDLARGGTAAPPHALAAVYLGTSVVFGPSLIAWADVRFAHWFAGGPAPEPKPTTSAARTQRERRGWVQHAKAWALGCGIMLVIVLAIGDPARTQALTTMAGAWTAVLAIDAAFSLPRQSAKRPRGGALRTGR